MLAQRNGQIGLARGGRTHQQDGGARSGGHSMCDSDLSWNAECTEIAQRSQTATVHLSLGLGWPSGITGGPIVPQDARRCSARQASTHWCDAMRPHAFLVRPISDHAGNSLSSAACRAGSRSGDRGCTGRCVRCARYRAAGRSSPPGRGDDWPAPNRGRPWCPTLR